VIKNTLVTQNTKVVYDKRGVKIVREQSYGWGCNSLSTMWYVYQGDEKSGGYIRLKRAKAWAEYISRVVV
jgi:hypothetical protein